MIVLGKGTFVSSTDRSSQSQSTQASTTPVPSTAQDDENDHKALIITLSVIASIFLIMAIVFLFLYLRYVIL